MASGSKRAVGGGGNICTLLVRELEMTNDETILDEITPHLMELLNVAMKSKNYPLIAKIYVLQAKLELLNFNIEEVSHLSPAFVIYLFPLLFFVYHKLHIRKSNKFFKSDF